MKISSMMDKSFFSLDASDTLSFAAGKFAEKKISDAPVTQQGRLAGIFTSSDLAAALVKGSMMGQPREADAAKAGAMPVGKCLSHKGAFLRENADVLDAISLLSQQRLECIPVVDGKGRVQGVVWAEDVRREMAGRLAEARGKGGKTAPQKISASEALERDAGGKTPIDQILKYVEKKGAASTSELARQFSLPVSEVEAYAVSLEQHGLLEIEYNIFGKMKLRKKG